MGEKRRNLALWLGLLFALLGPLSNGLTFLGIPPAPVPWISLGLPLIGFTLVLIGVWRAFRQSNIYRGKIFGSIALVLSALLLAASITFFWMTRRIPPQSASAPHVGQRVPDFTLPDSTGHSVSLMQLFSVPAGATPPKALLLVFYRGYW